MSRPGYFDYQKAMPTPWGKADNKIQICNGVYNVGTPSHGGIMIGKARAQQLLSSQARAIGFAWNQWLCFEEDCDWAAFAYEQPALYHAGRVRAWAEAGQTYGTSFEEEKTQAEACLHRWHPEYFTQ